MAEEKNKSLPPAKDMHAQDQTGQQQKTKAITDEEERKMRQQAYRAGLLKWSKEEQARRSKYNRQHHPYAAKGKGKGKGWLQELLCRLHQPQALPPPPSPMLQSLPNPTPSFVPVPVPFGVPTSMTHMGHLGLGGMAMPMGLQCAAQQPTMSNMGNGTPVSAAMGPVYLPMPQWGWQQLHNSFGRGMPLYLWPWICCPPLFAAWWYPPSPLHAPPPSLCFGFWCYHQL